MTSAKTLRVALVVSTGLEEVTLDFELVARPQGLAAVSSVVPEPAMVVLPQTGADSGRVLWLGGVVMLLGCALVARRRVGIL